MEVKERIKQLLKERNWTLAKLAREAHISQHAVYNWYNDKNYTPSRDAIEDVCAAFDITLAEFYTDIEVDKLSTDEIKLLELFKQVPENKRKAIFTMIQTYID